VSPIQEYGDAGLLVTPEGDDETRWAAAQALGEALSDDPPEGFVDVVASFRHVFVSFDPVVTDHAAVTAAVHERLHRPRPLREPRTFTVPVVYGGEWGPDLGDVARLLGMAAEEVVALHTREAWLLRFVGSPVAAPFVELADVPAAIPRVPSPRVRLAAGSVGLSGRQSMVYPVASPGGWRIVGRTPLRLFDTADPDLVPYRPGDLVRFRAVEESEWDDLAGRPARPDEPS